MKLVLANRYCFPDESATSRMVSSLAFALRREGLSVHLIAARLDHQRDDIRFPAEERVNGVAIHRIWTTGFGRKFLPGRAIDYLTFHLSAAWWFLWNLRAGDACIVCTDPPLLSVSAFLPVMLRRAMLINWIMDLFPEVAAKLRLRPSINVIAKLVTGVRDFSFRRARCNVAPIQAMADYLQQRGFRAESIRVLHHWSDGDAVVPIASGENPLRGEWGFGGKLVVAYSGNMGRAHEFSTIVEAATQLRSRSDIVFLFIGGGYWRGWVEQEAQRRGLDNIVFKPLQPRERLAQSLAVGDVHIVSLLPAMEPFIIPSKFFGIAAAGRPTLFVGDREGEISRLVRIGRCGACVPIGDAERLSAWIVRLRERPALRLAMGRNARRLFDAKFTRARAVDDWRRLLESMLAVSPARRNAAPGDELPLAREPRA